MVLRNWISESRLVKIFSAQNLFMAISDVPADILTSSLSKTEEQECEHLICVYDILELRGSSCPIFLGHVIYNSGRRSTPWLALHVYDVNQN